MLTQLNTTSGCRHAPHEADQTERSIAVTFWAALREALAGAHEYQSLRSRGMSHDRAIRTALSMGRGCSHASASGQRLAFAGRA
jgi:hypothetical protein